jgi:hypothetical protein
MKALWTWSGKSFGYRDGDDLLTRGGCHVGRFHEEVIFGPDGHYLGELRDNNRLIIDLSKQNLRNDTFTPEPRPVPCDPLVTKARLCDRPWHMDFPGRECFEEGRLIKTKRTVDKRLDI